MWQYRYSWTLVARVFGVAGCKVCTERAVHDFQASTPSKVKSSKEYMAAVEGDKAKRRKHEATDSFRVHSGPAV
ncbi:hypothetical protein Y1Q_0000165 [Alligator mississippiensis]|uniref:Secreted protein n=1 Tax=Alligator mississippiensis TaxID=8496 RepID=A0A151N019_ALLMI|nr:hypothetical protein Y1Q_0000165 [Alligator mississippiensis]